MDTNILMQKVLDFAVRGKLVPQNQNNEPASVLLEHIREEKVQMVKDGLLKKKDIQNDTVIFVGEDGQHYEKFTDGTIKCIEKEIPFKEPPGWAWARLFSICTKITDGTHHSPDNYDTGDFMYVTAKNIKPSGIVLDSITFVSENVHKEIYARCNPEYGDILYVKDGDAGIATVNNLHDEFSMLSSVALLKMPSILESWYICYALQSHFFYEDIRRDLKGTGIMRITLDMLNNRIIPIPPQNEQKAIAHKVKELVKQISLIENDERIIKELSSLTKSKVLDLAIRGQLVPQDPADEPASVLLEHIREEKAQMVKDGLLKKKDIQNDTVIFVGEDGQHYEKFAGGTAKCIEKEIPFKEPPGWAWTRLRNIASVKGGKRLPKGESFSEGVTEHAYIRIVDLKNQTIKTDNLKYISNALYKKLGAYTIGKNDLYITIAGTIGDVGEVPDSLDGMNLTENAVKVCNIAIDKTFLCYVLSSGFVRFQFQDKTHQVAMAKLAIERILGTLIPVCPCLEQKRIVSKIEKILATIEKF